MTLEAGKADELVRRLREIDGVTGVRLYRGVSVSPPGDVVHVEATDRAVHSIVAYLARADARGDAFSSITTSQPVSLIARPWRQALIRDTAEATWEEIELTMARDSNMTTLGLLVMAASGAIAVIGIATNALHVVVGAMLIAPGFQPIVRTSFGIVARSAAWKRGLVDVARGYGILAASAGITAIVLRALGTDPFGTHSSYLAPRALLTYWTSISVTDVLVTLVASLAGAVLIATHRSILTAGVMVALALVPSAAIAGAGAATFELEPALRALARWGIDLTAVAALSLAVFAWRRFRVYRRDSLA